MFSRNKLKPTLRGVLWITLFLIGVAEIVFLGVSYRSRVINERHAEVARDFDQSVQILEDRVSKYKFALQGLAGVYFVENHSPSPQQLRNYAESRNFYQNFIGLVGVGFIRKVPANALTAYEKSRAAIDPGFRLRLLGPNLGEKSGEAFVIENIEPMSKNQSARGLMISSEENRYEAAVFSRESGLTTLTKRISLVQASDRGSGFLVFHPVYRSTKIPATGAERRQSLVGWVYAPILMEPLVTAVDKLEAHRLRLRVTEVNGLREQEIYRNSEWSGNPEVEHFTSVIHVFEKPWKVSAQHVRALWTFPETLALVGSEFLGLLVFGVCFYSMWSFAARWGDSNQRVRSLEVWQRAIFDGADFAIITTDQAGTVTAMNRAATRMLGYRARDVIGQFGLALFHEDHEVMTHAETVASEVGENVRPGFDAFVRKTRESGSLKSNWTYVRKDGSRFPGQLTMNAINDESGEHMGFLAIVQDLTERVKAEHDLRQITEAINRSAIVATTDRKGCILEVNENFCALSGYSRDELVGKDHRVVNSGTHPKEFFRDFWSTIMAGRTWSGEIQNRRKDGDPYWVQSVVTPLYSTEGEIDRFLSIRFDVTEKKRAESTLIHSAQLASLGEMSGGIAHEINNPLAMIKGKASLMIMQIEKRMPEKEKLLADLEKINGVVDRIATIVAGLRAFSRDSSQEAVREESLERMLLDTVSLCQERFRAHGVEMRVGVIPNRTLTCRPVQVSQALLNLLNNAHDAVMALPEKWVAIDVQEFGDRLRIYVTDAGAGIPAEVVAKMMRPFFTTKDVGKGTGLGLSISTGLIEAQGGRLFYDETAPHTRFVIELTLANAEQNKAA